MRTSKPPTTLVTDLFHVKRIDSETCLVSDFQVCKDSWLRLHGCSENYMYSLKRKASDDYREVEPPKQKTHKWNQKYEEIKSFLENYFAPRMDAVRSFPIRDMDETNIDFLFG